MSYTSSIPYEHERIHAAAVYCSDGRVGEHFDDFLTNGLELPRYDRVALPGGPACLAGHAEARLEEEGAIDELRFLIEAHELERVVLIQHEGCAFYGVRLGFSGAEAMDAQRADLSRAAALVRRATGLGRVEAFMARRGDGVIRFEAVPVDG